MGLGIQALVSFSSNVSANIDERGVLSLLQFIGVYCLLTSISTQALQVSFCEHMAQVVLMFPTGMVVLNSTIRSFWLMDNNAYNMIISVSTWPRSCCPPQGWSCWAPPSGPSGYRTTMLTINSTVQYDKRKLSKYSSEKSKQNSIT